MRNQDYTPAVKKKPLKNGGWKEDDPASYWVLVNVQGRTVKLRQGTHPKNASKTRQGMGLTTCFLGDWFFGDIWWLVTAWFIPTGVR